MGIKTLPASIVPLSTCLAGLASSLWIQDGLLSKVKIFINHNRIHFLSFFWLDLYSFALNLPLTSIENSLIIMVVVIIAISYS